MEEKLERREGGGNSQPLQRQLLRGRDVFGRKRGKRGKNIVPYEVSGKEHVGGKDMPKKET